MNRVMKATETIRTAARSAVLVIEVLPMLPSKPVDWLTPMPIIEQVRYETRDGETIADLYRPGRVGPHPGILVCLGAVPLGQDHPQVKRLGNALARSGSAALLHWSPTMRDLRLAPEDTANMVMAYDWLLAHPAIDPARCGMLGTCVGGAFALMASADPAIRDRVRFVAAWAPFASMSSLARDIASATRTRDGQREPWPVDPLTREVFVRSLTEGLPPAEAERLRAAYAKPSGHVDAAELSEDARAILPLLEPADAIAAERAMANLPADLRRRLDAMSPIDSVQDIRAPLIVIIHDRDDPVIPLGETERLAAALSGRPGAHYIVFTMFKHLDPGKAKVPPVVLVRELVKFYRAISLIVRQAVV